MHTMLPSVLALGVLLSCGGCQQLMNAALPTSERIYHVRQSPDAVYHAVVETTVAMHGSVLTGDTTSMSLLVPGENITVMITPEVHGSLVRIGSQTNILAMGPRIGGSDFTTTLFTRLGIGKDDRAQSLGQ